MARPVEFDRADVLRNAALVFQQKGYTQTTMRDLVHATGLNESSIYNSFGNKRAMFLDVLKNYESQFARTVNALRATHSPREILEHTWWSLVDYTSESAAQGCLLLSAANEVGFYDNEVRDYVRNAYAAMEEALEALVREGQAAGEIAADKDARQLARFLANSYQGLRSAAALKPSREKCEDIVRAALTVLD